MPHQDYSKPSSIMQFFAYDSLPANLQETAKLFANLAEIIDRAGGDRNLDKQIALTKLVEAKEAALKMELAQESLDITIKAREELSKKLSSP